MAKIFRLNVTKVENVNLTHAFWDKIHAMSYNGILITPKDFGTADCCTPMPWDAGFDIKRDPDNRRPSLRHVVRITGGVDCQGFGVCEVLVPIASVHSYYYFDLEILEGRENELRALLESNGFGVEETEN